MEEIIENPKKARKWLVGLALVVGVISLIVVFGVKWFLETRSNALQYVMEHENDWVSGTSKQQDLDGLFYKVYYENINWCGHPYLVEMKNQGGKIQEAITIIKSAMKVVEENKSNIPVQSYCMLVDRQWEGREVGRTNKMATTMNIYESEFNHKPSYVLETLYGDFWIDIETKEMILDAPAANIYLEKIGKLAE